MARTPEQPNFTGQPFLTYLKDATSRKKSHVFSIIKPNPAVTNLSQAMANFLWEKSSTVEHFLEVYAVKSPDE
jgi:hypothetical protein